MLCWLLTSTDCTNSSPPSFHSPAEFTNTDQIETELCRKLPSLFRNDRARWNLKINPTITREFRRSVLWTSRIPRSPENHTNPSNQKIWLFNSITKINHLDNCTLKIWIETEPEIMRDKKNWNWKPKWWKKFRRCVIFYVFLSWSWIWSWDFWLEYLQ
jgi:hypothetical protein